VATVSVGGARNAGLLAVRMLAAADEKLRARLTEFHADLARLVLDKDATLRAGLDVTSDEEEDPEVNGR
jgi:5-(carboxyamino)imidazole ribonucleotide mutase